MGLSAASFDFAPYRLSGVVYGVLMNDPLALAALGSAAHAAPYKAPPRAPVLYVKPRNTLSSSGAALQVPQGFSGVQIAAALGLVLGRVACRLRAADALCFVAGYTIVNDVSLPHDSFYRPSLRFNARDGYCPIGPVVTPAGRIADPDSLNVRVFVDSALAQRSSTGGRVRSAAQLLADVTEFMTLLPGDVLMLGAAHGAPLARAGQTVAIEIDGLGRLENTVLAEAPLAVEARP